MTIFTLLAACAGGRGETPPVAPAPLPAPVETVVVTSSTESRAAPTAGFATTTGDLAVAFHRGLAEGNSATSGVSARLLFGMMAAGSTGSTKEAWSGLLGELSSARVDDERALAAFRDTPGVELTTINNLWVDQGMTLGDEFVTASKAYGAVPTDVPFSGDAAAAASTINTWCSENTNERITEIVRASDVEGAQVVAANALSFKGSWKMKFDVDKTQSAPFVGLSGSGDVDLMHHPKMKAGYVSEGSVMAISLPYEGDTMAMQVYLPVDGAGFDDLEAQLSPELMLSVANARLMDVDVSMPKFKAESEHDLRAHADRLGLTEVLGGGYDKIAPGLQISKAIQKVVVEVDEAGTEAAAVTAVVTKRMAVRPIVFRADQPFVYVIWHNETKTPLFMGRFVDAI